LTDSSFLRWESSETPSVGKKCSAKRVNIAAESVVEAPFTKIPFLVEWPQMNWLISLIL
jgi:hypothetical protein